MLALVLALLAAHHPSVQMKNLLFLKRRPSKIGGDGDVMAVVTSPKPKGNNNNNNTNDHGDRHNYHLEDDERRQDSCPAPPPPPPPTAAAPASASWHTTTTLPLSSHLDPEDVLRATEEAWHHCSPGAGVMRTTDDPYDLAVDDDDVVFHDENDNDDNHNAIRHSHAVQRCTAKMLELPDLEAWPTELAIAAATPAPAPVDDEQDENDEEHQDAQSLPPKLTAGPPSEIHIDFGSAPTSPMRDPSVIFATARRLSRQNPHDRYDVLEDLHDGREDMEQNIMRLMRMPTLFCGARFRRK